MPVVLSVWFIGRRSQRSSKALQSVIHPPKGFSPSHFGGFECSRPRHKIHHAQIPRSPYLKINRVGHHCQSSAFEQGNHRGGRRSYKNRHGCDSPCRSGSPVVSGAGASSAVNGHPGCVASPLTRRNSSSGSAVVSCITCTRAAQCTRADTPPSATDQSAPVTRITPSPWLEVDSLRAANGLAPKRIAQPAHSTRCRGCACAAVRLECSTCSPGAAPSARRPRSQ